MHRHIKPVPTPNQWGGIPNTWGTTPQSTPTCSPIGGINSIEHNAQTCRATCGTSPGPRAGHDNGKPRGESTPHWKLTPCTKQARLARKYIVPETYPFTPMKQNFVGPPFTFHLNFPTQCMEKGPSGPNSTNFP